MFYKFNNLGSLHKMGNFIENLFNSINKTTIRKQIMQNKECLMMLYQYL